MITPVARHPDPSSAATSTPVPCHPYASAVRRHSPAARNPYVTGSIPTMIAPCPDVGWPWPDRAMMFNLRRRRRDADNYLREGRAGSKNCDGKGGQQEFLHSVFRPLLHCLLFDLTSAVAKSCGFFQWKIISHERRSAGLHPPKSLRADKCLRRLPCRRLRRSFAGESSLRVSARSPCSPRAQGRFPARLWL